MDSFWTNNEESIRVLGHFSLRNVTIIDQEDSDFVVVSPITNRIVCLHITHFSSKETCISKHQNISPRIISRLLLQYPHDWYTMLPVPYRLSSIMQSRAANVQLRIDALPSISADAYYILQWDHDWVICQSILLCQLYLIHISDYERSKNNSLYTLLSSSSNVFQWSEHVNGDYLLTYEYCEASLNLFDNATCTCESDDDYFTSLEEELKYEPDFLQHFYINSRFA